MILGIYATLGVFLIIASRDPAAHWSLIWFAVWSDWPVCHDHPEGQMIGSGYITMTKITPTATRAIFSNFSRSTSVIVRSFQDLTSQSAFRLFVRLERP
jgi:hypothetical protein